MPLRLKRMREMIVAQNSAAIAQTHSDNPVLASLENDLRKDIAEMKQMESFHHRAFAKREKIQKYWHHVSGVISQKEAVNDNITRMMLVWTADAMLIDEFLQIAKYMMQFDISLPNGFKTSLSSFITDQGKTMVAHEGNEQFKPITATKAENINELITSIADAERQPNDESYAKFLKELGKKVEALESLSALKRAKEYYEKALTLNEKVGVKQDLTQITKKIESLEADKTSEQSEPV